MAGAGGWKIEVTGLRQVFDALDEMDDQAGKLIKKRIRKQAGKVRDAARQLAPDSTPISNWGPWLPTRRTFKNDAGRNLSWERAAVVAGFSVQQNNYRRKGVSTGISFDVIQRNAGGAVFEVVGSGNRVGEDDSRPWRPGQYLSRTIRNRYKIKNNIPRTLVPAYYSEMTPDFVDEIRDQIIKEAKRAGLT